MQVDWTGWVISLPATACHWDRTAHGPRDSAGPQQRAAFDRRAGARPSQRGAAQWTHLLTAGPTAAAVPLLSAAAPPPAPPQSSHCRQPLRSAALSGRLVWWQWAGHLRVQRAGAHLSLSAFPAGRDGPTLVWWLRQRTEPNEFGNNCIIAADCRQHQRGRPGRLGNRLWVGCREFAYRLEVRGQHCTQ